MTPGDLERLDADLEISASVLFAAAKKAKYPCTLAAAADAYKHVAKAREIIAKELSQLELFEDDNLPSLIASSRINRATGEIREGL
ncbi:MAG TPA: hypothetical protein DCP69_02885 [Candidatus Omnitrophica bacterium]|nr:hypothetical protein [Candidatus Omnitrophota bacterium]